MPIISGQGYGPQTARKQEDFRGLIRLHLEICQGIFTRNLSNHHYHYIDANAGSGQYEGHTGSPLIFLEEIKKRSMLFDAYFLEINPSNCSALRSLVRTEPNVQVIEGDHHETLPNVALRPPPSLGLIYCDPNGTAPPFDILANLSQKPAYQKMDVLMYLSASNIKRVSNAFSRRRLKDLMAPIAKKHWLVRTPADKHEWTFILGTNWTKFPAWHRAGFYGLDSEQGNTILEYLHCTKKEFGEVRPGIRNRRDLLTYLQGGGSHGFFG